MNNLSKYSNKINYILTHCASNRIQKQINEYYEKDQLTTFLDSIIEVDIAFNHWYSGHYHVDLSIDAKHTSLYNSVVFLLK